MFLSAIRTDTNPRPQARPGAAACDTLAGLLRAHRQDIEWSYVERDDGQVVAVFVLPGTRGEPDYMIAVEPGPARGVWSVTNPMRSAAFVTAASPDDAIEAMCVEVRAYNREALDERLQA